MPCECFFQSLGALPIVFFFFSNSSFCLNWTWVKTEGGGKGLSRFSGCTITSTTPVLLQSQGGSPKGSRALSQAVCKADALAHLLCFSSGTTHLAQATLHHVRSSLLSSLEWASCSAGRGSSIMCCVLLPVFTVSGEMGQPLASQQVC